MCYDVAYYTKKNLEYAKKRGGSKEDVEILENELDRLKAYLVPNFHVSAFEHPKLITFSQESPYQPELKSWGLIPSWIKSVASANEISNKTINARAESMFQKVSFKHAAKHGRCLVMIDGYFEHHHFKGRTFPFYVSFKDRSPMILAGLSETWKATSNGEERSTVSIVTTKANGVLTKIHNHAKLGEARMPVILKDQDREFWLDKDTSVSWEKELDKLLVPYSEKDLSVYTVPRIRGKNRVGNQEMALQKVRYKELNLDL